jgi:hypothetical protein
LALGDDDEHPGGGGMVESELTPPTTAIMLPFQRYIKYLYDMYVFVHTFKNKKIKKIRGN